MFLLDDKVIEIVRQRELIAEAEAIVVKAETDLQVTLLCLLIAYPLCYILSRQAQGSSAVFSLLFIRRHRYAPCCAYQFVIHYLFIKQPLCYIEPCESSLFIYVF